MKSTEHDIISQLTYGKIGVIPTDTIYGIVGCALFPETVSRIYSVRKRNPQKPCIILIASYADLQKFGIHISNAEKEIIEKNKLWPGKVSIIFPCIDPQFEYLTRGTKTLAFRMPDNISLQKLISKTGPLIAPSANIEGFPHATTIDVARQYFGNTVDFYVNGGICAGQPSKIIRLENDTIITIRN